MTMTRRRLLDDTFKKSVVGNPAIAQDSLARMYPGIEMQGWTEQAKTTGAQLLDASKLKSTTIGNVTITNNGDGSFTVGGNGVVDTNIRYTYDFTREESLNLIKAGLLYLKVDVILNPHFDVIIKSNGSYSELLGNSTNVRMIEITDEMLQSEDFFLRIRFYGKEGETIKPGIVKPMLYQSGNGTWEPYTGGEPSPSPDYPQEIVSAGKHNEDTQKWEYEITITNAQTDPDKNQSVTLTADRPLTKWDKLEKRNGQWGWVYKSAEIESYTDESVPGEYYSTTGQLSTGAQVWYETATETFAPLSESEQEAMNALHTYRPTTVLTNQQGCQMALTYKTRKGVGGGGNLLDLDDPSFVLTGCIYVSKYSVKCNIVDYYFSNISNYNLNDLIKRNIGKNIIFSCDGNPEGKIIGIVLYGSYLDGSTSKEINTTTGKEIKLNIEDATEFTRIELRFNRSSEKFTDTETIISNLSLKIE